MEIDNATTTMEQADSGPDIMLDLPQDVLCEHVEKALKHLEEASKLISEFDPNYDRSMAFNHGLKSASRTY